MFQVIPTCLAMIIKNLLLQSSSVAANKSSRETDITRCNVTYSHKNRLLFEYVDDMVNYNNFFCLKCDKWFNWQQVHLGGYDKNGLPMYVEVGGMYYFHQKYHRGRWRHEN